MLLAIADNAHDDGAQAWPSMTTLIRKTGLGERTVHRAVKSLVAMGELGVDYNAGPGLCNLYRVHMTPAPAAPPSERHPRQSGTPVRDAGVPERHPTPVTAAPLPPSERHPEPSIEPSRNRQRTSSSVVAIRPDIEHLCELLADGVQITTGERPKVNKRWHDACRLLLDTDGYVPQQVEALIRWSQTDEFWRSNILSMPKLREKRLQLIAQMQRPTRTTRSRSQRQVDQARQTYEEMMADATGGVGGDRRPPQPELARPADHKTDR